MKRRYVLLVAAVAAAILLLAVTPLGARQSGTFKADLIGYEEVPAVSTAATGEFRAKLGAGPVIDYTLTYSDIQNAFAAHIHFGQKSVNGGVSAFLCGGGDKPPCPPTGGTVSGTIDAADVTGPTSQGIAPGEIQELIDAMRAGVTYANVHTSDGDTTPNEGPGDFPGGEIRGQIGRGGND
jgi:hypothetical protein